MYLKQEVVNTIVIEKSKFICYIKHIKTEQDFKDYLSAIKKKHYDASHACSGFVANNIKRSSDDGEPSGTAGAPILNVLEKNNLNYHLIYLYHQNLQYAILNQAMYVYRNGDISLDSGYDPDKGIVAPREKLAALEITPAAINYLKVSGLLNKTIKNRRRFTRMY